MSPSFRGVQQSLSARGIRAQFTAPYSDGRSRIEVRDESQPRIFAKHTDDVDEAYIMGLRMASAREAAAQRPRVSGTLRPAYG